MYHAWHVKKELAELSARKTNVYSSYSSLTLFSLSLLLSFLFLISLQFAKTMPSGREQSTEWRRVEERATYHTFSLFYHPIVSLSYRLVLSLVLVLIWWRSALLFLLVA